MQQVAVHHLDLPERVAIVACVGLGLQPELQGMARRAWFSVHRDLHHMDEGQQAERVQGQGIGAADGDRVEPLAHIKQFDLSGGKELCDVGGIHRKVQ